MSEFTDHAFTAKPVTTADGEQHWSIECARCDHQATGTMEELAAREYPDCLFARPESAFLLGSIDKGVKSRVSQQAYAQNQSAAAEEILGTKPV